MESCDKNIKVIILPNIEPRKREKKDLEPKEIKKKVITNSDKWIFSGDDFSYDNQYNIISRLQKENNSCDEDCKLVCREIQKKIQGYKSQDILKKLYLESDFIDLPWVIQLLYDCNLDCYYCKEKTHIIYETVRELKQWSLERIDNSIGHNKGNVVIACLKCNVSRGTMYHERYAFTKQLNIVKNK